MKDNQVLYRVTTLLVLVILTSMSCTFSIVDPGATATCRVKTETAFSATLTAFPTAQPVPVTPTTIPSARVALRCFHGRYVTAMGADDNWVLRQETELGDCGWFIQHHFADGKVALETCHNRYVTAPKSGTTRQDWLLGQESTLSDCGRFDLYEMGNDRIALKTCAGNFLTAGDDSWPPPLQWSVVAETDILQDWEICTVLQQ